MIIEKYKCIYTNVPKTGSQSIKKFLGIEETHRPIYFDQEQLGDQFDKYFKFAIVRNPWDRVVSVFHYLKRGGSNDYDKMCRDKYVAPFGDDFKAFVRSLDSTIIWEQIHLKPQYFWLCSKEGDKLLTDFVGRFESLSSDWNYIQSQIGVDPTIEPYTQRLKNSLKGTALYKRLVKYSSLKKVVHKVNMSKTLNNFGATTYKLPHVNQSSHKSYKDYYDSKTMQIVSDLYRIDIELFGYPY